MVKEFNELCHSNGLLSIIGWLVRVVYALRATSSIASRRLSDAAKELGDSGADLTVEMPLYGKGARVPSSYRLTPGMGISLAPRVILSSGVDENRSLARSGRQRGSWRIRSRGTRGSVTAIGLPGYRDDALRDASAPAATFGRDRR